jgi:DnaJ domain
MNFLIGSAVVAIGWWLIRAFAKASPRQARVLTTKLGGYAVLALAALISIRGHFDYAIPLVVVALGMLGYQQMLGKFKGSFGGDGSRTGPQAGEGQQQPPPPRGRVRMSRDEALRVLGLKVGASADDVKAAHRRLLKDFHPDKGGTDYLAAKINEAKDVLTSG